MTNKQIRHFFEYISPKNFIEYSEKFFKVRGISLIDFYLKVFRYGATFNDYCTYRFYDFKHVKRRECMTILKSHKVLNGINDKKAIQVFSKREFNYHFAEFRSIKWIDCVKSSFDEFRNWVKDKEYIIMKDPKDTCGRGVHKLKIDDLNLDDYRKYFPSNYLCDEYLIQDGYLNDLNPASLNTIRVYTLVDVDGNVFIPCAILRIGVGSSHLDNAHAGGLFAQIDVDSGIVISPGLNYYNERYPFHPISRKQIIGMCVPRWENVKKTVIKATEILPNGIHYVGWDVALSSSAITLIEGNENADFMIQEVATGNTLWPYYKKFLKTIKKK